MNKYILIVVLMLPGFSQGAVFNQDEVIDQSLHFGIGAVATCALTHVFGGFALPVVVGAAFAREVYQHEGIPTGEGSARDLTFWTLGSVTGLVVCH